MASYYWGPVALTWVHFTVSVQVTILCDKFESYAFKITITSSSHGATVLIYFGRVTHICISKLTTIGSDNGLSPGQRQAIISTNAGILLIGPLGTNFSENFIGIQNVFIKQNAIENVVCEMASILSQPQCVNGLAPFNTWISRAFVWILYNYKTSTWRV